MTAVVLDSIDVEPPMRRPRGARRPQAFEAVGVAIEGRAAHLRAATPWTQIRADAAPAPQATAPRRLVAAPLADDAAINRYLKIARAHRAFAFRAGLGAAADASARSLKTLASRLLRPTTKTSTGDHTMFGIVRRHIVEPTAYAWSVRTFAFAAWILALFAYAGAMLTAAPERAYAEPSFAAAGEAVEPAGYAPPQRRAFSLHEDQILIGAAVAIALIAPTVLF